MNLHEYQAKQLFAQYGLPVSQGDLVFNAEEALHVASNSGANTWVVKAQVHAGGRGKAGGVKIVHGKEALIDAVKNLLGRNLVTYQTTAEGQPISKVLLEAPCDIARELYLGMVVDRASARVVIMASTEGGVDIETVAHETPEKIIKTFVDPLLGVLPFQAREIGFALGLTASQLKEFVNLLPNLYRLFIDKDFSLVEINPLVITKQGHLWCLDAKVVIDDNALFRQPEIRTMRDESQDDARENAARNYDLNYVALDGNIGCMVNGAGLAMATMDIIKLHGGEPANFLDVGGGATKERVTEAFKIILSDNKVKGILVNIFGGIVRCDLIAEGIIGAVKEVGIKIPVVVRLEGNNAELGAEILAKSGLNIVPAKNGLADAAEKIVQAVKGN
jgi:succinyl-CoA synthetase beta subunit